MHSLVLVLKLATSIFCQLHLTRGGGIKNLVVPGGLKTTAATLIMWKIPLHMSWCLNLNQEHIKIMLQQGKKQH